MYCKNGKQIITDVFILNKLRDLKILVTILILPFQLRPTLSALMKNCSYFQF